MSRILIRDGDGIPLVGAVEVAERFHARLRGLLGRASLPDGAGMLLRPCRSIHMWFMRFPIDAAFLDADLRVLRVVRHLRPWRIAVAPRGTRCVLETAAGGLAAVEPGRQLALE